MPLSEDPPFDSLILFKLNSVEGDVCFDLLKSLLNGRLGDKFWMTFQSSSAEQNEREKKERVVSFFPPHHEKHVRRQTALNRRALKKQAWDQATQQAQSVEWNLSQGAINSRSHTNGMTPFFSSLHGPSLARMSRCSLSENLFLFDL